MLICILFTEQNGSQTPCPDSGKGPLPGVDIKAIEKQMDALKTELVNAKVHSEKTHSVTYLEDV